MHELLEPVKQPAVKHEAVVDTPTEKANGAAKDAKKVVYRKKKKPAAASNGELPPVTEPVVVSLPKLDMTPVNVVTAVLKMMPNTGLDHNKIAVCILLKLTFQITVSRLSSIINFVLLVSYHGS